MEECCLPNNWTRLGCFISFMIAASSKKSLSAIVSSCTDKTEPSNKFSQATLLSFVCVPEIMRARLQASKL